MNHHEKINYHEFPARDIPATKLFFETVFGWHFEDFGPNYTAFSNQGVGGDFLNLTNKPYLEMVASSPYFIAIISNRHKTK